MFRGPEKPSPGRNVKMVIPAIEEPSRRSLVVTSIVDPYALQVSTYKKISHLKILYCKWNKGYMWVFFKYAYEINKRRREWFFKYMGDQNMIYGRRWNIWCEQQTLILLIKRPLILQCKPSSLQTGKYNEVTVMRPKFNYTTFKM